jgi:3-oxoacyl-[acyl-carrier-protein] synthase II
MSEPRIVITGMGAITPLGLNVEDSWEGLISGRSGVDYISHFDASKYLVKVAAEVRGFNPYTFMEPKLVDRTALSTQFAIAAAKMAIDSAQLNMSQEQAERVGVITATTVPIDIVTSEVEILNRRGPTRIDPLFIAKAGPHMAAVHIGLLLKARGPNYEVNGACAGGNVALGSTINHIRLGHADVMIAGGSDFLVLPLPIASMGIMGALSRETDPSKASRPFDLYRNGFVYGEGAGMVVLETMEHAKRRNAPMLAEVAGMGWSFDAYSETAPDGDVQAIAISNALKDAEVNPEEVEYVSAHGTSTKHNDAAETKAIKAVLKDRAYRVMVSSIKSMVGHMVSAAGVVEAIASVLTINRGIIPPTINYETPDPECDLDYVPNEARYSRVNVCLSNSFGMGGQNCCLVFRRLDKAE